MTANEWLCSIVLTNGNIIKIKVTEIEWSGRVVSAFNNGRLIAKINMDNVAGWINADYKAEIAWHNVPRCTE